MRYLRVSIAGPWVVILIIVDQKPMVPCISPSGASFRIIAVRCIRYFIPPQVVASRFAGKGETAINIQVLSLNGFQSAWVIARWVVQRNVTSRMPVSRCGYFCIQIVVLVSSNLDVGPNACCQTINPKIVEYLFGAG